MTTICATTADGDDREVSTAVPPNGRILFAGEHTDLASLAVVDGAWRSGVREAGRLLVDVRTRRAAGGSR